MKAILSETIPIATKALYLFRKKLLSMKLKKRKKPLKMQHKSDLHCSGLLVGYTRLLPEIFLWMNAIQLLWDVSAMDWAEIEPNGIISAVVKKQGLGVYCCFTIAVILLHLKGGNRCTHCKGITLCYR